MEELELDERKTKILDAIIRNYLETGEPARIVDDFKVYGFEFKGSANNSATRWRILEELGYIVLAAHLGGQDSV